MRIVTLIFALGLLGFTPNFSYASPRASIVATVNGDMISSNYLEKNCNIAAIAQKIDIKKMKPSELESFRQSILQDLIKETILTQEAKAQGLKVSDNEITNEIEATIASSGVTKEKFFAELAKKGYTENLYREKIRKSILTQDLINKNVFRKIIVTNDEVLDYYVSHGGKILGKANVALIVYKDSADMDKYAMELIEDTDDFIKVAKKISVGPYASEGGVFGEMMISDLAPAIQGAIASLNKGEVSKVFDLNGQYAQVKVLDKASSSENLAEVMDPKVLHQIQEGLRMQKAGSKVEQYVKSLEKKAVVNIR